MLSSNPLLGRYTAAICLCKMGYIIIYKANIIVYIYSLVALLRISYIALMTYPRYFYSLSTFPIYLSQFYLSPHYYYQQPHHRPHTTYLYTYIPTHLYLIHPRFYNPTFITPYLFFLTTYPKSSRVPSVRLTLFGLYRRPSHYSSSLVYVSKSPYPTTHIILNSHHS